MRADGDLAGRSHEQGVAVGHGGGGELRADHAVRAGLVIDHKGLSEQGPDMLAKVARQDVDAATRGMGHDHADRPRRVGVLRERAAAEGDTRGGREAGCDELSSGNHGELR